MRLGACSVKAGVCGHVRVYAALVLAAATIAPAQPAVADDIRDRQWHLRFLNIAEAHRHSQGQGVVVAVIDTGVDATHPDLVGAVLPGIDLTATGRGGDGRTDTHGHGTVMAGLIAGRSDGIGVLGIAPRASILPVRAKTSSYSNSHTTEGIEWAVRQGAQVLCIASSTEPDLDLQHAIEAAIRADVVVVAAAGNRPNNETVAWPAAYPGVVAAAGVDQHGNHANVSVTGPEVVLAAPAVEIVSTYPAGRYSHGTGTSNATAIIAGAAALVRAKFPDLTAPQVIHRLTATATDKGPPGRDDQYGHGVINIVKALTADVPPTPEPATTTGTPVRPPVAGPPHDPVPPAPQHHRGIPIGLLAASTLTLGLLAVAIAWYRRR
jgi:type VII secretion-associated serine protease mycosin